MPDQHPYLDKRQGAYGSLVRALGYPRLLDAFNKAAQDHAPYFTSISKELGTKIEIKSGSITSISKAGQPLVIVANHPEGFMDGLLAGAITEKVRDDIKFMTVQSAEDFPEFKNYALTVRKNAHISQNRTSIGKAIRHVKNGGCLIVFPAGRVAKEFRFKARQEDSQWNDLASCILRRSHNAAVVPFYLEERGGVAFRMAQACGIGAHARVMSMIHDAHRFSQKPYRVSIGQRIDSHDLPLDTKPEDLTAFLRAQTYALQR